MTEPTSTEGMAAEPPPQATPPQPRRPEPQSVLVNRIVRGKATQHDVAAAGANFNRWIREEWGGDQQRAVANCVKELAEVYGSRWDEFAEADRAAHVWMFTFLCPRRFELGSEASDYRGAVLRQGGFRDVAQKIRWLRGG